MQKKNTKNWRDSRLLFHIYIHTCIYIYIHIHILQIYHIYIYRIYVCNLRGCFFFFFIFFCESEMQEIRVTKILQNPTTKLLALD